MTAVQIITWSTVAFAIVGLALVLWMASNPKRRNFTVDSWGRVVYPGDVVEVCPPTAWERNPPLPHRFEVKGIDGRGNPIDQYGNAWVDWEIRLIKDDPSTFRAAFEQTEVQGDNDNT